MLSAPLPPLVVEVTPMALMVSAPSPAVMETEEYADETVMLSAELEPEMSWSEPVPIRESPVLAPETVLLKVAMEEKRRVSAPGRNLHFANETAQS